METFKQPINGLKLHALLLDTITHVKFKEHLDKNYISAKREFCDKASLNYNINSYDLIVHIGYCYKYNGMANKFNKIMQKFKINILIT